MHILVKTYVICCLFLEFSHLSQSTPSNLDAVCYSDARSLSNVRIDGSRILSEFQHNAKVVLIVNTASFCAYTYQYPGFNELQTEFGNDLVILGFPCNQFGLQEPGVGVEIPNTLRFVRPGGGYVPNFYLSKKIEVNGPKAHELFVELKVSNNQVLISSPPLHLLSISLPLERNNALLLFWFLDLPPPPN